MVSSDSQPPRRRGRARRLVRWVAYAVAGVWLAVTLAAAGYYAVSGTTVPVPPLDAHGGYVRTGDVTTHYERWRSTSGAAGPPIVLVHGFLESAWVWHDVAPLLAARGRDVYAIDVRGYGYTTRHGPYTLASDADQVSAFLAAMRLDAAHGARPLLVGHSSGAAIVAEIARRRPDAAAGIVLMDGDGTPYGVGPGWVHRLLVDPYATAMIRLGTRDASIGAGVYARTCGATCERFDAPAWLTPFRVPGAEAALKAILGQPLIGLTYEQERQIHAPAAVVYGAQDPEMTASDAAATASRLRTRTVIPIPGAGHLGMLSHPAALAVALVTAAKGLR